MKILCNSVWIELFIESIETSVAKLSQFPDNLFPSPEDQGFITLEECENTIVIVVGTGDSD